MAGLSGFAYPADLGVNMVFDDDTDLTASSDLDNGPGTVHFIEVENADAAQEVYLSLWNSRAPVVGTDAPDVQFPAAANTTTPLVLAGGWPVSNGWSWAASQDAGTAIASAPSTPGNINVRGVSIPT